MLPSIPSPEDYEVSSLHGFLPDELPLERLPDPYYRVWEDVIRSLQGLVLSRRLRGVVERMPTLSTDRIHTQPFLEVCNHLELPPVATYAGVVLWNFKPIFPNEPVDQLENLSTLLTFTGSMDESWFYLVSVAIEARAGPTIPIMLDAIRAAREGDSLRVTASLQAFAERLDELGSLLNRMYEHCDPHVFYNRIRPFLAGSKNMADAGLPRGVMFDPTGTRDHPYVQYGGGSNAQSSVIQFFDLVLGVQHSPTGQQPQASSHKSGAPPSANFIHDMRTYMPGPHRRFLQRVADVANIREYVEARRSDIALTTAYDACLAMLRELRDRHIRMVSRYIIVKSHEAQRRAAAAPTSESMSKPINLANTTTSSAETKKKLRGTGGTALIPFLKQAREETGEPAIGSWARRIMSNGPAYSVGAGLGSVTYAALGKMDEHSDGKRAIVGLAGIWSVDDSEGGICHWYILYNQQPHGADTDHCSSAPYLAFTRLLLTTSLANLEEAANLLTVHGHQSSQPRASRTLAGSAPDPADVAVTSEA
ncbi:hypothetical protein FH972_021844 [Carpinus fangiana]|uniref:Indoleamine 2,3-dioxygenase n=1 Tax=Carpinus fangiana TaxID=176857 RepID=A0A5N6KQG8_9ROSI|nr:hypothetical protein FH972_021844 [Carpinus fangiana]